MSPYLKDANNLLTFSHVINQTVLRVDPARIEAFEFAAEFLVRGRILEGIISQHIKKDGSPIPEFCLTEQFGVFQCPSFEFECPITQSVLSSSSNRMNSSSDKNSSSGVFEASSIDSRTPGMDER